jgi:hypothetical protein
LKAKQQPGGGVDDLRAAIDEAASIDPANPIFSLTARRDVIDASTADLWRDYLAALLARTDARPLGKEDLAAVTDFADHGDVLQSQPQILAMLRMLLLRQGEPQRVRQITPLDLQQPVDPDTSAGVRTPWQIAGVADAIANDASRSNVTVPADDQDEFLSWQTHACNRDRERGASVPCPPQSTAFAGFENSWRSQYHSAVRGEGWLSWMWWLFGWAVLIPVSFACCWIIGLFTAHDLHRIRIYQSKMRSYHYDDTLMMEQEAAEKGAPARA